MNEKPVFTMRLTEKDEADIERIRKECYEATGAILSKAAVIRVALGRMKVKE